MSEKFYIYAITVDNMSYVGSTNNLKRRMKNARSRCFNPKAKHYTCMI